MKNLREHLKLSNINYGNLKRNISENDNNIWTCNDRENIFTKFDNEISVNSTEWQSFRSEFLALLLEVNKRPKLNVWQELNKNLSIIGRLTSAIVADKELTRELGRVRDQLHDNPEFSYLLEGMETKLTRFLPVVTQHERPTGDVIGEKRSVVPMRLRPARKTPSRKIMPDNVIEWFVDPIKGDLFDPRTVDVDVSVLHQPTKIRMRDFLAAIGGVAHEIVLAQFAFERPLENLIKALNVDWARFGVGDLSRVDEIDVTSGLDDMEEQNNDLVVNLQTAGRGRATHQTSTGRQVAIAMIKNFHLRQMRVAYLNYEPARIKDFYALVTVDKFELEPEHYIFSSFGILHRLPDGSGTAMSLTDWYRESVLFYAMKCIPFVKNFLVNKHFQGWRNLTIRKRHVSIGKYLTQNLMPANVVFGKSLLQIFRLLDEISQVTFAPKHLIETQTESSFIKSISKISKAADSYLEKFYKFIQMMANETAAELYKSLQFCQAQLHSNNIYSNDSIYLKRIKKLKREQAVQDSLNQVYKLGDFVRLINYMLNSKIVEITLNNIVILAELMCSMETANEETSKYIKKAIFHTKIIIISSGDQIRLSASPGVEEIEFMFTDVINRIPRLILKHCYPLDGLLRSEYLERYQNIISETADARSQRFTSLLGSKTEIKTVIMEEGNRVTESISTPELPYIELPTKRQDDLRVATPPKVNPNILNKVSLKLVGRAIPAKFTPLNTSNVFEILKLNPLYISLMSGFDELFSESKEHMDALCLEHRWLVDVRSEYLEWSKIDMNVEWIDQSPYIFEQRLVKVKNYMQVLDSTDRTVTLINKVFLVHLESILEELLSEMEFEMESIISFLLDLVRKLGLEFIEKISAVLEVLHSRSLDVALFSKVLRYIALCRDNHVGYQKSVDYIKSLFDVLRITGKPISEADRSIEDQVTTLWESFMFQLQEANDFVNEQKQNVLFGIKSKIQELEEAARSVEESITSEKYTNLSDHVEEVLADIFQVQDDIEEIRHTLDTLFECYQSLTSEDCERSVDVNKVKMIVNLTHANWTLLNTTNNQLKTWKLSLFSRFPVAIASDIILAWQRQIEKLKENPDSKSEILLEIEENVSEFSSFMPFFNQLSSPMFLLQHWQQFFLEIGHPFVDPYEVLSVQVLIDLDLRNFPRVLDVLYNDAIVKNKANREFDHHMKFWLTREFEFEQHTPDICYKKYHDEKIELISTKKTAPLNRSRSELEKYHESKISENKQEKLYRLPITNNEDKEIFLVSEFSKLHEDITDTIISIQSRKQKDDGNERYSMLVNALEELRCTITVLLDCQEKWLFLERIFEEECFVQSHLESAAKFAIVNKELLSILFELKQSPITLHHITLGQIFLSENYADKQMLKLKLKSLIEMMAEIISDVDEILTNARNLFPRLYFLPDYEVVRLLSCEISQNFANINHFVHLCFPAIASVIFSQNSEFSNQMKAVSIVGSSGEKLDLFKPVLAGNVASQWFMNFELVLKSTVKFLMNACVSQQLTEISLPKGESRTFITDRVSSNMFEEIDQIEKLTHRMPEEKQGAVEELVNDILETYETWLMKYPLQVLLVTEKIHFTKQLTETLQNKTEDLVRLKTHLLSKRSSFVHLLSKVLHKRDYDTGQLELSVRNLLILNDRHVDMISNLQDTEDHNTDSFVYKCMFKYRLTHEDTALLIPYTRPADADVVVESVNMSFIYDYEYLKIGRCDLLSTAVTDRVIVSMLMALNNFEVGTLVGPDEINGETMKTLSEILGRNLFTGACCMKLGVSMLHRYVTGSLLSGTLLYLEQLNTLGLDTLSNISKDVWELRSQFLDNANKFPKQRNRRSSSPSRLLRDNQDDLMDIQNSCVPESGRINRSKTASVADQINFYALQNYRLNKGVNFPFHDSAEEASPLYMANHLFRATIYNRTVDVRYGFGICASVTNGDDEYPSLPLSLKCQMRTLFMVDIDRDFVITSQLILVGQERHSQQLECTINKLIQNVTHFLPHMLRAINKLLPLTISSADWTNEQPINALKKSFLTTIVPRISNTFRDQDIFKSIIDTSFPADAIGSDTQQESGLIHQIKCQIRLRDREVVSSDVDKILQLKTSIDHNRITIVTGCEFAGKTSAVDILVQALNSSFSQSQTPRFESKSRGAIDVLKSISNERKLQLQLENLLGSESSKRIYQQRLSLSNFTADELSSQGILRGNGNPSVLASIIEPLMKWRTNHKFQIWLCVETDATNLESHMSVLQLLIDESVKIIVEVETVSEKQQNNFSSSYGIVQFEYAHDRTVSMLEHKLKGMLENKVISYYGNKYLQDAATNIFMALFKFMEIQIEASKIPSVRLNFVVQSLDILELVLMDSKEWFMGLQEDMEQLVKMYNTVLIFSIIQGARGLLYSILVGKRFFSHEEFESGLRNALDGYCDLSTNINDDSCSSVFGLMVDRNTMSVKHLHGIKGCAVPEYGSCADGVARYMIQLLMKYNKSVFINAPYGRHELFLDHIRYNKRINLNNDLALPVLRKALYGKDEEYWNIVSNEDALFNKTRKQDIVLLEDFVTDAHLSGLVRSLLQFCLEHKFLYDLGSDAVSFHRVLLKSVSIILMKQGDLDFLGFENSKWTRWLTVINIIDPHFVEARSILYRAVLPWIRQIPKQNLESSRLFATGISNFIIDAALAVQKDQRNHIMTNIPNLDQNSISNPMVHEQRWSRIIRISKSLTSLPLDLFVKVFQTFEKKYPIESLSVKEDSSEDESVDTLKLYKNASKKIRVLRYFVFVVSRFVLDPVGELDDRDRVTDIIIQNLDKHFINSLTFEIDEMMLKHFPLPVESITDVLMLPSRVCDDTYDDVSAFYQPIFEAHSWKLLQKAQTFITDIKSIEDYVARFSHLKFVVKSDNFLKNLMKMYRHISGYLLKESSLFFEYSSSLVSGMDWGIFLAGLIQAEYVSVETSGTRSVNDFFDCLRHAMYEAGKGQQKVIFHLDTSLVYLTEEICEIIMRILQQDTVTSLLEFLQLSTIHGAIVDNHKQVFIKSGSFKEVQISKIFLENIQRNLKILLTANKHDLAGNMNVRSTAEWFLSRSLGYLVVDDDTITEYKSSLDPIISILTRSYSDSYSLLGDAHWYFGKSFHQFIHTLGARFYVNGRHLQMCAHLYEFWSGFFRSKITSEIEKLQSAIKSVNNCKMEIENLRSAKNTLEDNLKRINEYITVSSNQVKTMRDSYGLALIQCKKQEQLISELTGPLNDLKEKSKSNLNDVSPTYMAALDTIRNLDPGAVEEIKTYIKPPRQVRELVETIFYLLGYETSWEEIKEIMVKINVYEELLYFDKDHIDDRKYNYVLDKIKDPSLRQENLFNISQAAASLSGWLFAIFKYSSLNREINPQLGELLSIQDRINMAQAELGKMKVRTDIMRQDLEAKLEGHKELLFNKKGVTDQIRNVSYKINMARNLLSDLTAYFDNWTNQLEVLNQQIIDLPLDIVFLVIENVYLGRFPRYVRSPFLQSFQRKFDLNIKTRNKCEIFENEQLRSLISSHMNFSLFESHLENAVQLAMLICCPLISFPNLGSMVLVHCYSDGSLDSIEIIRNVLESSVVSKLRVSPNNPRHNEVVDNVHYADCSRMDEESLDKTLRNCMSADVILVVEKLELLSHLGPCMQMLLYGKENEIGATLHCGFRLVLLTREIYSVSDKNKGLFSTTRLVHLDFSLGDEALLDNMQASMMQICQPRLFEGLLECEKQIFELNILNKNEKNCILQTAASCLQNNRASVNTAAQSLSSIPEGSSLLDIPNFHTTVLKTDSKSLALEESIDTMKKKYPNLLNIFDVYFPVAEAICLLLRNFNFFPFDSTVSSSNGDVFEIHEQFMTQKQIVKLVKDFVRQEVQSVAVVENVDPEITGEFLQKLKTSVITALSLSFEARLDADEFMDSIVKYCIDFIVREQKDLEGWTEVEIEFMKTAILCKDKHQLLSDNASHSLNFIHNQTNVDIPKETLHLSLIIETNLLSLSGLSKSVTENEVLWKEYFSFPFIGASRMPGFSIGSQPGLLPKAVVWRLLNTVKSEDVLLSLIGDVFGENIFKLSATRNEILQQLVLNNAPLQPIVLSSRHGTLDTINSPLELIGKCHRKLAKSSKVVLLDCSCESDMASLFAGVKSTTLQNQQTFSIDQLVKEPVWLVLMNAHLYRVDQSDTNGGLDGFIDHVWKKLCTCFSRRSKNTTNLEFRLFITLEKLIGTRYPVLMLEGSLFLHCRAGIDLEKRCVEYECSADKSDSTSRLMAILQCGMFDESFFHNTISCSTQDLKTVAIIGSIHVHRCCQIMDVIRLVYEDKIVGDERKKIFRQITVDLSPCIDDFLNQKASELATLRNVRRIVDKNVSMEPSVVIKSSDKLQRNDGILVDQRSVDLIKSRLVDLCRHLQAIINIDNRDAGQVNQIYVKKVACQILKKILELPIWCIRFLSDIRFDLGMSVSDISSLIDQYYLCNDKLPSTWPIVGVNDKISSWLECIDELLVLMDRFVEEESDEAGLELVVSRANILLSPVEQPL